MAVSFPELAAIRLGYGLSPLMAPPASAGQVLASVAEARPGPDAITRDQVIRQARQLRQLAEARRTQGEPAQARYRAFTQELRWHPMIDLRRRLARAVDAPAGFGERLVQFWADHFTIRADGSGNQLLGMAFVDQAIRPYLNGRFEDMLIAADTHPMMLRYLNQNTSYGPNSRAARRKDGRLGLNENLAREAIELHSLGVGADYAQADVRQLAELLTGLTYRLGKDQQFFPNMAEPGSETVLGRSYGGNGRARMQDVHAVLTDLARHPSTARHLARKLAVHFVSDQPSDALVGDLASVWAETMGDLPQVYAVLATHPDLARDFRQKARQPFELVASSLRALGLDADQVRAIELNALRKGIAGALDRMVQPWNRPKGPDGWPEAANAWITPQGLAARIEWALQMPRRLAIDLPDPRGFLETALGDTADEALRWAVPKAESTQEGVAIVLASNAFNRR